MPQSLVNNCPGKYFKKLDATASLKFSPVFYSIFPGPACFSVTPNTDVHNALNCHDQGEGICRVELVTIQHETVANGCHRFKD
jgi:hypothetical protein